MEQKPVVGIGDVVGRDMSDEGLFHLEGGVVALGDQPQAVGNTEDMGVDSEGGLAEGDTLDDIGCLATNTRQVEKGVHIRRHLALVMRRTASMVR